MAVAGGLLRTTRTTDAAVFAGLVFATVVMLFPIYIVVITGFKQQADVTAGRISPFVALTLDNYRALIGLTQGEFHFDLWLHLRNTLVAAVGSTVLATLIGVPAAYAFARVRFRGSRVALSLLLIVRLLPPLAAIIPLFIIMRTIGLLDTQVALILAYTSFNLPFFVWIMFGFFRDLPHELAEAAQIDGATHWQTFTRVMVPLCAPGVAAAAIFSVILAWNDFIFAVVLTSRKAPTLPMLVSGFITDMGVAWGIIMAAGSVIAVPVLVFALLTQRHLLRGILGGAVKG